MSLLGLTAAAIKPFAVLAVPMPLMAVVGHRIGSVLGRHRLPPPAIKRLLAAVHLAT